MISLDGIVIVEGKDDKTAVSRVLESPIFVLHGMNGVNNKKIEYLKELSLKNRLYLLTDPDFAGVKIRDKINRNIPGIINLYADRFKATKNTNVGIENMSDDDLIAIFKNIRTNVKKDDIFTINDLIENDLTISKSSKLKRELLGDILSISYSNTKQLLKKLNSLNITKEEFNNAMEFTNKMYDKKEKNAVIFGKFFPAHKGHINFIKQVSRYCKNLYVFVCEETNRDKKLFEESTMPRFLSIEERRKCIVDEIKGYKNIKVFTINEDGITPYPNGWENWAKRVITYFEKYDIKVDIVFTNEIQDKDNYEKYLNLKAYLIDSDREKFNISSTKIRGDINKYKEFLPDSVKKAFKKNEN